MIKKYIYIFMALQLFAFGCAWEPPRPETQPPALSELVARTLSRAAEESHADLALIARLRSMGAAMPALPPPDAALAAEVTMRFTGPAATVLRGLALHLGYRFAESGRDRALELPVLVEAANKPAHQVLEDIAWQIYPQAEIRLDTASRVITLGNRGN